MGSYSESKESIEARGALLKSIVVKARMTPKELSEHLGIHRNTIYAYLKNPNLIDTRTGDLIASKCKMTVAEILQIFYPDSYHRLKNTMTQGLF